MGKCELAEGCGNYRPENVTCNEHDGKFGLESYCRILREHKKGKNPTAIDYSKIGVESKIKEVLNTLSSLF